MERENELALFKSKDTIPMLEFLLLTHGPARVAANPGLCVAPPVRFLMEDHA